MHSIRSRITLMTICAMAVAMTVATLFGIEAIQRIGNRNAEQILMLLCQTGEKNLDAYFDSVEQSVSMVSAYVESDLTGLEDHQLQAHMDRVSAIFQKLTYSTNGVLTYYYRIDPAVSRSVKGFWYVYQDGEGFQEHQVTDITLYDTEDTSALVWFTVPKSTGKPVWLPPYITDNLGARVISYNVPVYLEDRFVGVIGIEIDYSTMMDQVDNIRLYQNGYAFINDDQGRLIYHPRIDVTELEEQPPVPEGLLSGDHSVTYQYDGVEKLGAWLPLENGMRLNVSVPVAEISADWQNWAQRTAVVFGALLVIFSILAMGLAERITKPLRALTQVAEQVNAGNYDCVVDYHGSDEVGILTDAFLRLTDHLKTYINNLNYLAYADALTSVHNKGAFDVYIQKLQSQIQSGGEGPAFAVCIFDCNNLKGINDRFGHGKGDLYLKNSCAVICHVYDHSPVYRVGGDEFAAILQFTDYEHREALLQRFDQACAETCREGAQPWEQVHLARGMAVYDPGQDGSVNDVVRRADKKMYEHKWQSKQAAAGAE